ncbi:MAG TPA: NAD(P)H-binding protein [Planctomycetota bacterium]|nr:NAD(P)H-binding protein [Planctomycetota bacterium]
MGNLAKRCVFVTGATGYLGRPLTERLLDRGHAVRALVRAASASRLPPRAEPVVGDALDPATYASRIQRGDVLVHLVGVAHPSPAKAAEFQSIDRASIRAATDAARTGGASRFVYVSVAQPAPIMKAYLAVRAAGEAMVRDTGLPASILRPWYVLGPGHRWPVVLLPLYAAAWLFPASRETSRRLGLITRPTMIRALVRSVESDRPGVEILDVPALRSTGRAD